MGCRIVHTSHPSSKDPDAEFRFSFSVAEFILFHALSADQKKCFIAFKALVKYRIYRSEIITKNEIDLNTYHLKTIFLWTCETIPADQWKTTNGWARCLLYMIDQLYSCLKSRKLPGYFIPESNLVDSIELPKAFFSEIRKLRRNPITSAATFLDSTRCFRHLHFKISDHIQDLCGFDSIEESILRKQLIFLQRMTIEMDSTRYVTLWKKEAVLRIFAIWCLQNSHEIHLAPWQCLTREMTLFDVVNLDILHNGFHVPNNVLLEYVDREWSAEVVCKLASCYSMKVQKREDRKHTVKYLFHRKSALLIHWAIKYKHPTSESIITSVSILIRCEVYKMAANVLIEFYPNSPFKAMSFYCKELYADIVSHTLRKGIQEMSDIQLLGDRNISMVMSIPSLVLFSLCVCFKYCFGGTIREQLRESMLVCLDDLGNYDVCNWQIDYLLMLETIDDSEKWKSLHYKIYNKFVSSKLIMIEQESEARKDAFERLIVSDNLPNICFSLMATKILCSCNMHTMKSFKLFSEHSGISDEFSSPSRKYV